MIAIIDYGVGNLFSLTSSFREIGKEAVPTRDEKLIRTADRLILPGVGAFGDAARKLRESGMFDLVREEAERGKPVLGICLGMQLLFERSFEYGEYEGLGLVKGEVRPFEPLVGEKLDIPHIGWNALSFPKEREKSPVFCGIEEGDCVYFVHSYAGFDCDDSLIAWTEYGIPLTAAVQQENVYGMQFHPEKSGSIGLRILKNFAEL
ncbi:MAG: imidazole glycerol phosphate synthase subunit HisH [Eubacteriales bacterium]|nr:imidazole glycerol phosphate synthase subunit HisH [Eubacteriales bacterium]